MKHLYTVIFTKYFLTGNLAGMEVCNQRITFPTIVDAKTWLWDMGAANNQINRDIITKDKFKIVSFVLVIEERK